LLHEENVDTGGGPKTLKPLFELAQRLMALLFKIVITGAPNIPEGGITQDMAIRDVKAEIASPNEYIKFYCHIQEISYNIQEEEETLTYEV
jgi:hypothetical protein